MPENPKVALVAKTFNSKHLAFERAEIERLNSGDVFEIVTPAGTFRMSRADFEAAFPEVVNSVSYRDLGLYHFPKIPYKAFRFLVREHKVPAALAAGSAGDPGPANRLA